AEKLRADHIRMQMTCIDEVVTRTGRYHKHIVLRLGVHDAHVGRKSVDGHRVPALRDLNAVVAGSPFDGHMIALTIPAAWVDTGQIDRNVGVIRAAQVVNYDVVASFQCGQGNALDVVQIHGDVAYVAE